jgi:hypothetical protein
VNRNLPSSPTNLPLIRASELAQYSFCQRAWWLTTVKKVPSQNQAKLSRGSQQHTQHEGQVRRAGLWQRAGFFLISSGTVLFILMLLWFWLSSSG